jgi:putative endonuclease
MFTVYLLQSVRGKRYVGHTSDLDRRLLEHNSGLCKTTKTDRDWKVIYSEEYTTKREAIKRERWMKTGIGQDFIDKVTCGAIPDVCGE